MIPSCVSFRRRTQPRQSDVLERYQVQVQEKLDAHSKKTSRQKYAKSEAYAAFKQSIYVGHDPFSLAFTFLLHTS